MKFSRKLIALGALLFFLATIAIDELVMPGAALVEYLPNFDVYGLLRLFGAIVLFISIIVLNKK